MVRSLRFFFIGLMVSALAGIAALHMLLAPAVFTASMELPVSLSALIDVDELTPGLFDADFLESNPSFELPTGYAQISENPPTYFYMTNDDIRALTVVSARMSFPAALWSMSDAELSSLFGEVLAEYYDQDTNISLKAVQHLRAGRYDGFVLSVGLTDIVSYDLKIYFVQVEDKVVMILALGNPQVTDSLDAQVRELIATMNSQR